ncbi:MAG: HAMP domain-containing histidine kinase [Bacteroidetes bacterium]|nr:HAMP domain-containing histidine kinase [Bacteroidota bacterium]
MRKLLSKSLKPLTLYALLVLMASIPAYYYLVDSIWQRELDEHNQIIAYRTAQGLNRLHLSNEALSESIQLWNTIQPGTNLRRLTGTLSRPDSTYTVLRQNPYTEQKDIDRFRGLSRIIQIHGSSYELIIETNIEETEETVAAIAIVTFFFFLVMVIGFLLLNKRLSARLWKPFRSTLARLKTFRLSSQSPIEFEQSDTLEFEELNDALSKLIAQNISVYASQKEFTENAAHELQTPLAIIKNKLDLLLQQEPLTDRQYRIIEEANRALTRITRINKNLLLLAKIENHQFDDREAINVRLLIEHCIEQLKEHFDHKKIPIQTELTDITIEGNKILFEVLLNNLLLNAVRHNREYGNVRITLHPSGIIFANSGSSALDGITLFKRFGKLTGPNSGSGLGLAIVKEICNRHGWQVSYRFEGNLHTFSVVF